MPFLERLIDQLRTEHLALVSIIEKMAGGKRVPTQVFDDLEGFETTMRRTAELVKKVQGQVFVPARGDAQSAVEDDVPFGLVKDRVEELRRGIVGYALVGSCIQVDGSEIDQCASPGVCEAGPATGDAAANQLADGFHTECLGPCVRPWDCPDGHRSARLRQRSKQRRCHKHWTLCWATLCRLLKTDSSNGWPRTTWMRSRR